MTAANSLRQPAPGPYPALADDVVRSEDRRLSYVNPRIVAAMQQMLRAQTSECVMETFGISVNTWVRLRDGLPIRTSVAERLVQRLAPRH